eukprot:GEZU01023685.1.p3 GENE.GEZU01023685.1~~GEZU01023685.1.p3  ORF type:complete len:166 (-),score=56.84 GEZU01023685.1:600-1097(-)
MLQEEEQDPDELEEGIQHSLALDNLADIEESEEAHQQEREEKLHRQGIRAAEKVDFYTGENESLDDPPIELEDDTSDKDLDYLLDEIADDDVDDDEDELEEEIAADAARRYYRALQRQNHPSAGQRLVGLMPDAVRQRLPIYYEDDDDDDDDDEDELEYHDGRRV